MTKRSIVRIGLGWAAWSASVVAAGAQLSSRPFAVAGDEGGGGAEGGVTGWLMSEQSWLTHLIATKVHELHGQPSAAWVSPGSDSPMASCTPRGPDTARRFSPLTCWRTKRR